jgi:ABC-type glycerol-3-phosphate transport system substrate-binding protein
MWNWVPVFAGRFMDNTNQKVLANDPHTVRALEYVVQLRRPPKRFDISKIDALRRTFGGRTPQNPFLVGKLAMNRTGPWDLGTIKNYAPASFEIRDLEPAGPARRGRPGRAHLRRYSSGPCWRHQEKCDLQADARDHVLSVPAEDP